MDDDVSELLRRARAGSEGARIKLFDRYRDRLRKLVDLRMDPRLRTRVSPSDVVQDSLLRAWRDLEGVLAEGEAPFYIRLRHIALLQLADLYRAHVEAARRSVRREQAAPRLPRDSSLRLADILAASTAGPDERAADRERRAALMTALESLPDIDREILALRYLEELSLGEIASILSIDEAAAKRRHLRALDRLRGRLAGPSGGTR